MARRKKNNCTFVPEINGEPSEMYVGLIDMHVERPLANYLYAKYKASNAAAQMDAQHYQRNNQGEHSATDIYKFFNVSEIQKAQGFSLSRIENKYGIVDNMGERVSFSAVDAYNKAKQINDSEIGHVAKVVKRGDVFTVVADKKDSRTQVWQGEVAGALVGWQTLQNGLRNAGIDADTLASAFPELVNPMDINRFLQYVYDLRRRSPDSLSEKDIEMLLYTGEGSTKLQALSTRGWGDKAEMAEKMYDILHNPSGNYAQSIKDLVTNALNEAKTINNSKFDTIYNDVKVAVNDFHADSESAAIEATLTRLDKDFEINHTIIVRTDKTIKRLSDATAEAVLTLQRQLRYLQKQEGRVGEGLEVEKTLDQLTRELASKKYYAGLLGFLSKANRYSITVSNMLKSVSDNGNAMEYSIAMGKALSKATTFRDGYNVIVQALRSAETLLIDENMSNDELSQLKDIAEEIAKRMDRQKVLIEEMQEDLTLTVAQEILGSDTANGVPIAQLVKMGAADSSLMDFLYSCERVSDPIVASLGTVIRDAQRKRDRIASEFAARIEQANRIYKDSKDGNKGDTHFMYQAIQKSRTDWESFKKDSEAEKKRLREAGYAGTEFYNAYSTWYQAHTREDGNGRRVPNEAYVVEDTEYRVYSNHDYEAFEKDKAAMESNLRRAEITGFAFNDEMERWMNEHTIEEVVDAKSGRTERVPNHDYDIYENYSDFENTMTDAQRQYYYTMMQIKGEVGTLLPSYAQKQYLPPQRRASWVDIVTEGKRRGLTAKQVAKNILNRMNFMKQKEDDTTFVEGGIIGEKGSARAYSSYDDTILRQVPIYFINPLRDQSDILMDFSGAVQSLGAIAANYAVINGSQERTAGENDGVVGVREVVENMADYLKYRPISDRDANGRKRIDLVKWGQVMVGKVLRKNAEKTTTASIVDGFVAKHIYNEQLALGSEDSVLRKLQLAVRGLLGYTSVTALSVNVKGAVSNWLVGEYQMMFESISGSAQKFRRGRPTDQAEFYTLKDYVRADAIMFGQGVRLGTVMDHLANTTGTLGHLLERKFDPLQEVYSELGEKRYYSGVKKLIGGFNWMGLYSAGESLIHLHNMYAVLCNEKVLLNGKQVSLYDVFDREMEADGKNAKLIIKEGATMLDGSAITDEYLEKVQGKIRLINQKTHGSMNTEDKGNIHRFMMGRAAMQFKQWMVEHYSRRYRGRYFDGTTRTWQEGYYNTVYKMMKSWVSDLLKLNIEANCRWDQLDNTQKNNVTRAISELVCFAGLLGLSAAMGDPKDHKGEGLYRFLIYQIRRLIMDEEASIPPIPGVTGGVVKEGTTLAQTPFAFIKTVNGLLYPVTGLGELGDTYSVGRNKGKNKYVVKVLKNTVPFYGQIDQLLHMDTEDYVYSVFDNIAYNKGK